MYLTKRQIEDYRIELSTGYDTVNPIMQCYSMVKGLRSKIQDDFNLVNRSLLIESAKQKEEQEEEDEVPE